MDLQEKYDILLDAMKKMAYYITYHVEKLEGNEMIEARPLLEDSNNANVYIQTARQTLKKIGEEKKDY